MLITWSYGTQCLFKLKKVVKTTYGLHPNKFFEILHLKKSKVEIMTDFTKLNDEIPVCVAATVDNLQVMKLK